MIYIYSTHVLRQVIARLPAWPLRKWSEHSLRLRRYEEPSLYHFERWLQDRVIVAAKDPYLPQYSKPKKIHTTRTNDGERNAVSCPYCKQSHLLFKCDAFKSRSSNERLTFVKGCKLTLIISDCWCNEK